MKLTYSHLLTFSLITPAIFSLFYGVLGVKAPVEFTMYVFLFAGVFLLRANSGDYKIQLINSWFNLYYLLFLCVIGFFFIYPSHFQTAEDKALRLLYLVVFKIFALSLLNYKYLYKNKDLFYKNLAYSSSVVLCLFFVFYLLGFTANYNDSSREVLVGFLNPIWFSRFVADFCFAIVFYMLIKRKFNPILLVSLFFGLLLLFSSGSRGPFVALFITIYILIYIKHYKYRKKIILVSALLALTIFPLAVLLLLNFNMYSVIARQEYILKSITFLMNNIWGYGFSSFGMLVRGVDVIAYPHNIFFEILVEIGIIGFIIFILLLKRAKRSFEPNNIFSFLFIMSLINAQFSGDIASNSYIFIYLFLSIKLFSNRPSLLIVDK
jgi:hypothetical protein